MDASPFELVTEKVKEKFGLVEANAEGRVPFVRVEPRLLARLARFLQGEPELAFDFLMYVTAVDYPEEGKITLVYHYFSYKFEREFVVKADVPREGGRVPTVSHLYAAAEWLEREVYDLFGVTFENHPNLTRILTPENFEGHPLLKDFQSDDLVLFPDKMPGK